jgi:hypothetical protein
MRLVSLEVKHFGCVKHAELELDGGLNVLFGPNDLGKSTLVEAIRAALLLPVRSAALRTFAPWGRDETPEVRLVLRANDQRFYRINKTFGLSATLEWSNDGKSFSHDSSAREVDERIRQLLQWGLPAAPGTARGMPDSFLTKVLIPSRQETLGVLSETLATDKDDSGKKQIASALLSSALAALAEEPLFKQVLERATLKVNEAFTTTRQRKRNKGSPWLDVRDRINRAGGELEQLQQLKNASATTLARLRTLEDELLEHTELRDAADRNCQETEARFHHQARLHELEVRLERADHAVAEARRKVAEAEVAEREEQRLAAHTETQHQSANGARAAFERAQRTEAEAREALHSLEQAAASQELALRRATLEKRLTEVNAEVLAQTREGQLAQEAAKRHEELGAFSTRLAAAEGAVQNFEKEAQRLAANLADADERLEGERMLLTYWRYRELERQLARARDQSQKSLELRAQAEAKRREATQLERELGQCVLPSESTLRALRELEHKRSIAEGVLARGLLVEVTPLSPNLELDISEDEGATRRERLFAAGRFSAQRSVRVGLSGAMELQVSTGTPQEREELRELRRRWQDEAMPVLNAAKAADLAALEEAVRAFGAGKDKLGSLRRGVTELELRIQDLREQSQRADALAEEVHAERERLADYDREELERCAGEYQRESEIASAVRDSERDRQTHEAALGTARSQAARSQAQRAALAEQHSAAQTAFEDACRRLSGSWQIALQTATTALQALVGERNTLERNLTSLEQEQHSKRAQAQAALGRALEMTRLQLSALEAAQAGLRAAEQALASHRGGLRVLQQEARNLDTTSIEAAATALRHEHATVQAARPPSAPVSDRDRQAAQLALKAAEAALHAKNTELAEARGSLSQVGGDVVEEQVSEASAALRLLQDHERELELEYGGWLALHEALRSAESHQAQDLGDALGSPIQERFAALTGGRYTKVAVGSDLRTGGFELAGELRSVNSLSQGTLEQLSALFRLCLAERLQSAVILDDHLSQTDSQKMLWFQNALQSVARRTQIVVITCWPEHYGVQPEGDSLQTLNTNRGRRTPTDTDTAAPLLRVVDLRRVIERY